MYPELTALTALPQQNFLLDKQTYLHHDSYGVRFTLTQQGFFPAAPPTPPQLQEPPQPPTQSPPGWPTLCAFCKGWAAPSTPSHPARNHSQCFPNNSQPQSKRRKLSP